MDTLKILSDTLINNLTLQNDTITHKVHLISSPNNNFFKMDNPLWYVLTLIIAGYFTYLLTKKAKKEEIATEAKKLFLDKRINCHNEIYEFFFKGMLTTNISGQSTKVYYIIFNSSTELNDWFDELLNFASKNKLLLKNFLTGISFKQGDKLK